MSTPQRIADEVADPMRALGLHVEEVTVTPAGRRRVVRVAVDVIVPQDGPTTVAVPALTLDEVADATREVSDALDSSEVMGEQPYVLEVTSPGVDRPLTTPRHFRRNVGRVVQLTLVGGDVVSGRVTAADDGQVDLEVAGLKGRPGKVRTLAYADIAKAAVQVEFSRPGDDPADHPERDDPDGDDDFSEGTQRPATDEEN